MIWDLGWFKAPQTLSCRALTIDQDMLLPNHKVAEIVKIGVDNAKLQPIITYSLDLPLWVVAIIRLSWFGAYVYIER